MTIYARNPASAVVASLARVLDAGQKSSPRGESTYELLGESIRVEDPSSFVFDVQGRNLKHGIGLLEGLQLVAQTSLPSVMTDKFKVFARWTDGNIFDGAYGVRAHGMIRRVVEQLGSDSDTRQAVITIFDSWRDLNASSSDVPCTLSLHFLLREDKLHMITTMRSNDVWRGLPYDLMQFIMLQHVIADHFQVGLGSYTHNVGSLHVYESDLDGVDAVLSSVNELDDVLDFPRPLFTGDSYADFVRRAELLLVNTATNPSAENIGNMTLFEGYCLAVLSGDAR
jgi:thymidylate synthase